MAEQNTKFAIISWEHKWEENQLVIRCTTDTPCHLWLAFTWRPTRLHMRADFQRGVGWHWYPKFCFVEYTWQEQIQSGDTISHIFAVYGGEPGLICSFVFIAYIKGFLCYSKMGFIKAKFNEQGEGDELSPSALYDAIKWLPWETNFAEFVLADLATWNKTLCTLTGTIVITEWGLAIGNGADPASVAEAFIEHAGDLELRYQKQSQLRALIHISHADPQTFAYVVHGSITSGSGYGFLYTGNAIYLWTRCPTNVETEPILNNPVTGQLYLLEAKFTPGLGVEYWINGEYITGTEIAYPTSNDSGPRLRLYDPNSANTWLDLHRFMLWQESIWSGGYHILP